MDYVFRLVLPDIMAGFLVVVYILGALIAINLGQRKITPIWMLALLATTIGAWGIHTGQEAATKALGNPSQPQPHLALWYLVLAGAMVLLPLVGLALAVFESDLNQTALWSATLLAALALFGETGFYHFHHMGWTGLAAISQVGFIVTGSRLAVFVVYDIGAWLKDHFPRRTSHSAV